MAPTSGRTLPRRPAEGACLRGPPGDLPPAQNPATQPCTRVAARCTALSPSTCVCRRKFALPACRDWPCHSTCSIGTRRSTVIGGVRRSVAKGHSHRADWLRTSALAVPRLRRSFVGDTRAGRPPPRRRAPPRRTPCPGSGCGRTRPATRRPGGRHSRVGGLSLLERLRNSRVDAA
jgi:hypothetical protein